MDGERFDPGLLDEEDPFEIDIQAAHLFKHPHLGIDDIDDVWASGPLFYPEEMTTPMTPDEEYAFYARPENQEPQGPGRRRDGTRLSAPVPVRFPPELLEQARRAADAVDRSLSSWIRLAVEHELRRNAKHA